MSDSTHADRPTRTAWALDVLACLLGAAVLLPASADTLADAQVGTAWTVAIALALSALHLPVAVARALPRTTFLIAAAAMATLACGPLLTIDAARVPAVVLPSALMFFYPLYVLAMRLDSRTALTGLGLAILGGAGISVRLAADNQWTSDLGNGTPAWLILTLVALLGPVAAWALGRLRATRIAYLAEIEERARRTEADRAREAADAATAERARIAAEMHDTISHSLAVIVAQAEGGRMVAPDERTRGVLRTIGDTGRTALQEMRSMLGVLAGADDVRRDPPQPGADDLERLAHDAGADFTASGDPQGVSAVVGLVAYRIVQESLTNALKHGTGTPHVEVAHGRDLLITVTNAVGRAARATDSSGPASDGPASDDEGQGAVPGVPGGGLGLAGMRQRASSVGGRLDAGPVKGGWRVFAVLPRTPRAQS